MIWSWLQDFTAPEYKIRPAVTAVGNIAPCMATAGDGIYIKYL